MSEFGYPIVDTREYRTTTFTTLLGAELHGPQIEVGEPWHILGVGLPLDFAPPAAGESGPEIAARASSFGAFIGMAHPAWYTLTLADALALQVCDAVEVFNQTAASHNDRGDSWYMSDLLSARGRRLFAYAADDSHFIKGRPDDRLAWIYVLATKLTPEDLLAALKAGHFYSSQGPRIEDVRLDNRTIQIRCSPASAIFVSGRGPKTEANLGSGLTSSSFRLDRFVGSYARVTIVDAGGKRAWTNPFWLD